MELFSCSFSDTGGSYACLCPQTQNLSQSTDSPVLYESKGSIFKVCKKETLIFSFKNAFKPNFKNISSGQIHLNNDFFTETTILRA